MSLELLLMPLGVAAFTAWREASETALCEKCRTTRITDQALLVAALAELGAVDVRETDGRVTARTHQGHLTFQRIGEVFLGRVDDADDAVTTSMLSELEVVTGHITQARTVADLRTKAHEMGMVLVEEKADDGTIQLVFEVQ